MIRKDTDTNVYKTIRNTVLKHIVRDASFIIPDISKETGISMTTVGKYLEILIEEGLIEASNAIKSDKRGRRPILYRVKSESKYFAAIDIKQESTDYGLMSLSGDLIASETRNIPYENSTRCLENACQGLDSFLAKNGGLDRKDIIKVCVCVGGRVNTKEGSSASKFVMEELMGTNLAQWLQERLKTDTILENDTKAMTYGEYRTLTDKNLRNVLYINVSWGIGLGIVIDGKLYYGKDGYAGEFGHSAVYKNEVFCHCGKKGCLETEVSGSAIHRKLCERIKNGEASRLSAKYFRGEEISLADIIEASSREDPLCVDLISWTGTELGRQISTLVNIFNPDGIILGGDLSKAASYYFLYPLSASLRKYSLKLMIHDVPIVVSSLGKNAGIYGACLLARDRYFQEY